MKLSRRELVLLIILIIMSVGVLFYQFVYTGRRAEILKLESELKANTDKLAKLMARQHEDEKYLEKVRSLDAEIRSIERRVPYIKDMPGMLVELYYMILEHRLEGNSISFSNITEGEKYDFFNISFEVKGNKSGINDFLQEIESFRREMSINSISFIVGSSDILNVKLNLKVYLLKDAEPHKEPVDYDFMEGKYGDFRDLYEMFKITEKSGAGNNSNVADSANAAGANTAAAKQ